MSASITVTIDGSLDRDRSTIVHTIRQALMEAALDVQDDNKIPSIAMTTLYEQQTRLAMAGTRCIIKM